jgi:hypothetical protein
MTPATLFDTEVRSRVRQALEDGGRVRVTVTSKSTGRHLTVRLACKRKGEDGRWVSRARIEGRVGLADADAVFADGGDQVFGGWVATYYPERDQWYVPTDGEAPVGYEWSARQVIAWVLGTGDLESQADIAVASECSYCGKGLTDPQSIERGIGPECYGRHTTSRHA